MKKLLFVAGVVSGVVLARNWRTVAKKSIKGGILAARKFKEVSEQVKEDLEDISAEAVEELLAEELSKEDQEAGGAR